MAEKHLAICDECGKTEDMREIGDGYGYPHGWHEVTITVEILFHKLYERDVFVCGQDCFDTLMAGYRLTRGPNPSYGWANGPLEQMVEVPA
ncbi:MAG TPA: hypothetical protein VD930_02385 [Gemmatimonadales bacterium]|nr:hypothetical protein [Gemmatimonadales bacterium]